jgi:hypothetical protein
MVVNNDEDMGGGEGESEDDVGDPFFCSWSKGLSE